MSAFHQFKSWIRHWLLEVDQHSIHSPYFFDFFQKVIRGKTDSAVFAEIEALRANLLVDTTVVEIQDHGAGSVIKGNKRSLHDIAATSISSRARAELYARLIAFSDARRIVELGSCLGVTTLYLAQKKRHQRFYV